MKRHTNRRTKRKSTCGELALLILLAFLLAGFFGGQWEADYANPGNPDAIRTTLSQSGVHITMPGDDR